MRTAILGLIAFLSVSFSAQAEYCDMAGCPGPGYVFIPMVTQKVSFFYGGVKCRLPEDGQTFAPDGLPAVNSEVQIVRTAQFYDDTELSEQANAFAPPHVVPAPDGKSCSVTWHEPDGGMVFRTGQDRVRILGYRTVTQHYTLHENAVDTPHLHLPARDRALSRQLLFALVTTIPAPKVP